MIVKPVDDGFSPSLNGDSNIEEILLLEIKEQIENRDEIFQMIFQVFAHFLPNQSRNFFRIVFNESRG